MVEPPVASKLELLYTVSNHYTQCHFNYFYIDFMAQVLRSRSLKTMCRLLEHSTASLTLLKLFFWTCYHTCFVLFTFVPIWSHILTWSHLFRYVIYSNMFYMFQFVYFLICSDIRYFLGVPVCPIIIWWIKKYIYISNGNYLHSF